MGFPVAMKISSPQILHKSDAGGVRVNIKTEEEARDAFLQITKMSNNINRTLRSMGFLYRKWSQAARKQ